MMAPVELHRELWLQVTELLRRPLPRPNGKQERSAVTQDDLAAMMRVSKLHNNLTAPLLYKHVVCDYLPSFVYGIEKPPAARGIQSKRELIGHLERLFLEYYPKNEASYSQLLRGGWPDFARVGVNGVGMVDLCAQECAWIAEAGKKLEDVETKLLTFSTGVFLGSQSEIWEPYLIESPPGFDYHQHVGPAGAAISALLHTNLVYYCQRVGYGPLAFGGSPFPRESDKPRTEAGPKCWSHRIHHGMGYLCSSPVLFGGHNRWYCPFGTGTNLDIEHTLEMIGRGIAAHLQHREQTIAGVAAALAQSPNKVDNVLSTNQSLHVDIYVPHILTTPRYKKRLDQEVAHAKKEVERMRVPRARYEKDVWRIRSVNEAVSCEACGWCVDDL